MARVSARRVLLPLCAVALVATGATGCGSGGGDTDSQGRVKVVFWHGQTDIARTTLEKLVADFNRTHPKIHVETNAGAATADTMLPKVTTALASGKYPDVCYLFGSDLADIAHSKRVDDLTDAVKSANWEDFWPAERAAATVKGRVRGIPSESDNLAVVYNKALLARAGLPAPQPNWTWDDFRRYAKKLTDPGAGVYGTSWPGIGDEDTTWRLWPMLWQEGGEIVTADQHRSAFDSPAGVRALSLVKDMAVTDKSVYIDTSSGSLKMNRLFNDGKMGLFVTGPWSLPDIRTAKIDYAVAPLPGVNGSNVTISGSDNWVVLDHGSRRRRAAEQFVLWLTSASQNLTWMNGTGALPLRASVTRLPGYAEFQKNWPGLEVWTAGLENMRPRPTLRAYPKLSKAVGQAVASVLLGRSDAKPALEQAAKASDTALAGE